MDLVPRRVARPSKRGRGKAYPSQRGRELAIARTGSVPVVHEEAPRPPSVTAQQADARMVKVLFHILSPLRGGVRCGHITRLLQGPVGKEVRTSVELSAALRTLAKLRWFQLSDDGFTITAEAQPVDWQADCVVYVENLRHSSPFAAAAWLAEQVEEANVLAVYPPTLDARPTRSAQKLTHGQAFVVLNSPSSAIALAQRYPWNDEGVRCLTLEHWLDRKREYFAWRDELRESNRPIEPPTYPEGTILRLELETDKVPDKPDSAIKAALERLVPSSVAYVDLAPDKTHCLIRTPTRDTALSLTAALERSPPPFVSGISTLKGEAQQAYWLSLPAKVRNAALKRASL